MTNNPQDYHDAANEYPEIYQAVKLLLLKKLPLFNSRLISQVYLYRRAKEITYEVIDDYFNHYLDQYNGQYDSTDLKNLITRDVDLLFIKNVVSKHINKLLYPPKRITIKKNKNI